MDVGHFGHCFFSTSNAAELNLFVPGHFVPLSGFKRAHAGQPLELTVRREILKYAVASRSPFQIAFCPTQSAETRPPCSIDQLSYLNTDSVDARQGKVRVNLMASNGIAVVVNHLLINELPVGTHWDQQLNQGRGGQRYGGTDQMGSVRVDAKTGAVSFGSLAFDNDPQNPSFFNTNRFALFSSDLVHPFAKAIGFERYVGEDYSIFSLPDSTLIALSEQVTVATGWPVVNHNGGLGAFS